MKQEVWATEPGEIIKGAENAPFLFGTNKAAGSVSDK
jgi:hypothetical protein